MLLAWDIETAPLITASFGLYDQNIPYHHVIQEWFIICAAFKVIGEDKIESVSVLDDVHRFIKDHTDDYHVVKKLHSVISRADAIIAHNNNGFDWKKFMARVIYHGLPPVKQPVMIDTLAQARKFGFTSRKLDDLGTHLKLGNKLENERGLWVKAAQGDVMAIRKMVRYCKGDIPPLENLFFKLRPYMPTGFNMNHYSNSQVCPKCGCSDFKKKGVRHTSTGIYQRYQCLDHDCRAYFQSGKSIRRVEMR